MRLFSLVVSHLGFSMYMFALPRSPQPRSEFHDAHGHASCQMHDGDSEQEEPPPDCVIDIHDDVPDLNLVEAVDIAAAGSPHKSESVDFTVDSGACVTIALENCFTRYPTLPTPESAAGHTYTTASGGKVLEQGKRVPIVRTDSGALRKINVFIGPVRKALACVAGICDNGYRVVFDNGGGFILDRSSGEILPIRRQGKLYKFRADVRFARAAMSNRRSPSFWLPSRLSRLQRAEAGTQPSRSRSRVFPCRHSCRKACFGGARGGADSH